MTNKADTTLHFDDPKVANLLFGPQNEHVTFLANKSQLLLSTRGASITLEGPQDKMGLVANLLTQVYGLLKTGTPITARDFPHAYSILERDPAASLKSIFQDALFVVSPRKSIAPKTLSQREYVNALRQSDMTFAVGPAGTGKTYLAVAMALSLLFSKKIKRIILTRPAVEAGEKLGFLPGDMTQKVDPYLRPLYDALHDMLHFEKVIEMLESGTIEVAPLAFMRGRTLNDAFIILDEAQNTTPEQMKMFVTRLGFGSRAVITGDISQIDLPTNNGKVRSGLIEALHVLANVEGISILQFHHEDVIRHPLVGRIVQAYDKYQTHSR